jgi:hypothetical protein
VAAAVARSAIETGVAKIIIDPEIIAQQTRTIIYEGGLGYSKTENFTLESAR